MTATVPSSRWAARMDQVRQRFELGRQQWQQGNRVALFDPADAIAWYVFQATAYASSREDWFEPEGYRIAMVFKRLGMLLSIMKSVEGVEDRVEGLMWNGRKQPDQGLYELLVAGAYKSRRWAHVSFVPEQKGGPRTHDLSAVTGRRQWAIECKRVNSTGYEADERARGEQLAEEVHAVCRARGQSLVMSVSFKVELATIPAGYLAERAESILGRRSHGGWNDSTASGVARPPNWAPIQSVLAVDDVAYGGSRLAELLFGEWLPSYDHSVAANWEPAPGRPFYATSISRASSVRWTSDSPDAEWRKAKHFRALVSDAVGQLPGDRPAAIHVGYEARNGNSADQFRHLRNALEMRTFDPGISRLKWVYANYMAPEHVNNRNEAAAISETTAHYAVRGGRLAQPLPGHTLFSDGYGVHGDHW